MVDIWRSMIDGVSEVERVARTMGVRYETAWRWFRQGDLPGQQLPSGTIVVFPPEEGREDREDVVGDLVAIVYVSSARR